MISPRQRLASALARFVQDFDTLNRIEVSRRAILHNFDHFQTKDHEVFPVLKSNAYGHGLEQVATILKDRAFPYIAVDGYFEAQRIQKVSEQPVLVMGYIKSINYGKLKTNNLAFVVHDEVSLNALKELSRPVKIHLELNTGMNRHGIALTELDNYLDQLRGSSLELEGLMSHLADADGPDEVYTKNQIKLFDSAVERVRAAGFNPRWLHIAQTAGSTRPASKYANAVRLGIGLYGINPLSAGDKHAKKLAGLQPAMKLVSTITKIIPLQKGDRVSYNGIFEAPQNMNIAVLPLGYYEGLPRALSNRGVVKHGKGYLPIVGKVCMNHIMISLDGSKAKLGDEVTVISSNPDDKNAVNPLCAEFGLFNYELAVGFSRDVRRVIVD